LTLSNPAYILNNYKIIFRKGIISKLLKNLLFGIQLIFSFMLVAAVVLHPAKGMGLGGIGSPAQIFGSQKGAESGLNKITAVIVIVWAVVSVLLSTTLIIE